MLNPLASFVVVAMTRAGIADEINKYLKDIGKSSLVESFAPNDDRLTDELCTRLAAMWPSDPDDLQSMIEWQWEIDRIFLKSEVAQC